MKSHKAMKKQAHFLLFTLGYRKKSFRSKGVGKSFIFIFITGEQRV